MISHGANDRVITDVSCKFAVWKSATKRLHRRL